MDEVVRALRSSIRAKRELHQVPVRYDAVRTTMQAAGRSMRKAFDVLTTRGFPKPDGNGEGGA
jgi:Rad3-related DNA helicase